METTMDNLPELPEWELIEGYYEKTLSESQKKQFEGQYQADAGFRERADAWKETHMALKELALYRVVQKTVRQTTRSIYWQKRIRLGIAVSALAVILVTGTLFSSVDIQRYQQDLTVRNTNPDAPEGVLTERQKVFYKDFFEGQSYLADGQPALAIPYFERVLNLPELRPYFRQSVEWQLVNAYLLADQPENAHATYRRLMASGELIYPIRDIDRWRVKWQIGWKTAWR